MNRAKQESWKTKKDLMISCGKLEAHHIKFLYTIIQNNKIKNLKQALNCKELWDIDNGITYCDKCHKQLHKEIGYKIC